MRAARAAGVRRIVQQLGPVITRIVPRKFTPRAMNDVGLQAHKPARWHANRDRAAELGACIAGHNYRLRHHRKAASIEGSRRVLE